MWDSLRNVLTAYAAHDPVMGYVQSMNFIAAFLLLAGLGEEDAFWCLVALVTRVVPGYFSEGMAAAKLDQRVFAALLHAHLPAIGLHLESLAPDDIVTGIIASQWLLTLFVNVLPAEATTLVWDHVFATKSRAPLFAAALALLEPSAGDVLAAGDMGEAIELLQALGSDLGGGEGGGGEKVAAFRARLDELLAGDVSPANLDVLTARVRGRRRRPSDAGLPASVLAVAPLTDVDELMEGVETDATEEAVGARALARLDRGTLSESAAAGASRTGANEAREREEDPYASGSSDGEWEFAERSEADGSGNGDAARAAGGFFSSSPPPAVPVGMAWAESLIAAGAPKPRPNPSSRSAAARAALRALRAESDAVRRDAGGTGMGPFAGPGGAFSSGTPEPSRGGTERFDSLDSAFGSPVGLADLLAGAASFGSGSGSDAAASSAAPPDGDDLASSSLASFPLPRAVADDLAARIERLERALRALPTHAGETASIARTSALLPLAALRDSTLAPLKARFATLEAEFQLLTQRALALGRKGLGWRRGAGPGVGSSPLGDEPGGAAWTAWADSLFERAVERADDAVKALEDVCDETRRIVRDVEGCSSREGAEGERRGGPTHGGDPDSPDSPPNSHSRGGAGLRDPLALPSDAALASAAAKRRAATDAALRAVRADAEEVRAAARRDLPVLEANAARVSARLRREASDASRALAEWNAAAEARRERKSLATRRAVREAADAADAAFDAKDPEAARNAAMLTPTKPPTTGVAAPISDDGVHGAANGAAAAPPSFAPPSGTLSSPSSSSSSSDYPSEDGHSLEEARLDAAAASVASAAKALARRKAAAGREREAAALVAAKARDARSDAERRLARLKRVEAAVRSALASRAEASSSSDPLACAAEEVTALGDAASDAWRASILRWSAFAREKIASVAMGYVTVVDAACESASELAEELAAEIADVLERERGGRNARNYQSGGHLGSSFVGGDSFSPGGGGGGAGGFLNGLLEDAAAGFASRAGGGAESSSSPAAPAPPPGSSSSSSSSSAAASTSHHTMKDAFRAQSTKALKNLAGGLGSAAGKIQETFQSGGGALGALGSGWALGARRFGGRGDHGSTPNNDAHRGDEPSARRGGGGGGAGADANAGGPPGTTTTTATPAEDGEARSLTGGPTTAAASPGTGTGTGIPGTGTPGTGTPSTRVQRAVAEARADLARLEARRDALAARKRRMRGSWSGGGGGGAASVSAGGRRNLPRDRRRRRRRKRRRRRRRATGMMCPGGRGRGPGARTRGCRRS